MNAISENLVRLVEEARQTPAGSEAAKLNQLAQRTNRLVEQIAAWGDQRYRQGMEAGLDMARQSAGR